MALPLTVKTEHALDPRDHDLHTTKAVLGLEGDQTRIETIRATQIETTEARREHAMTITTTREIRDGSRYTMRIALAIVGDGPYPTRT
jgi:hypothetical protein